jgi:hypothetical protein
VLPRAFLDSTVCVFASGSHLARDQVFLAAARLHVKPAALQAALPLCVLVTNDVPDAERTLRDAQDVGLDGWMVTSVELARADRARRVVLAGGIAEITTATRVRNVTFARLASLVDLRWKAASETRVVAFQPDEGAVVLVSAKDLDVEGPSRVGAVLKVQLGLQQAAAAAVKDRVLVLALTPQQLGVPLETPAEVVALALVEGVRRRANR